MTRLAIALLLELLVVGCAARRPLPIVQEWTAVLLDAAGDQVVHTAAVTQIYPFLTWKRGCPLHAGALRAVSYRVELVSCGDVRRFKFNALERDQRLVFYRELP